MDPDGPGEYEGDADSSELGDEDAPSEGDGREKFEPEGFERWRRDSAVGSVGTGIARGLQSVFAPPPDPPAIVAAVPGDPPDPDLLKVILDPDDPSKSVALLPRANHAADHAGDYAVDGDAHDAPA
jgi:hypothetical protein